jgi:hypothetical protein
MRFSLGADIEVKTRWKSNLLGQEFDDKTFKGKVVKNPTWLDSDYISLHTGNPEYPVSYIHKKFIVGHVFAEERSTSRLFAVKSKSSGKVYNVASFDGDVTCECVGFQFRRKCKHSAAVKAVL